jgi:hypothetical protein
VLLPWVIGMTVMLCHFALVPVDGCSINPARSFGSAIVTNTWKAHWIFWLAPFFGATLATIIFEGVIRPPEMIAAEMTPEDVKSALHANHNGNGQLAYDQSGV